MPDYYNDLITEKSWKTLQELQHKLKFVLIGGWAVYLYTHSLKSKDIDIIVDFDQLDKLRNDFDVVKNERLKKYEARREEVQIDVYLPRYSNIGVPVEKVLGETKSIGGFKVLSPEAMLILKQLVFKERGLSAKGMKDRLDIISLLSLANVDFDRYFKLTKKWNLDTLPSDLWQLVKTTVKIPELSINEHKWGQKKKELGKIGDFVV